MAIRNGLKRIISTSREIELLQQSTTKSSGSLIALLIERGAREK